MNAVLQPESVLKLLEALADGRPRAGRHLASMIELAECDFATHRRQLADHRVTELSSGEWWVEGGVELLDSARIEEHLRRLSSAAIGLDLRGVTGSTNDDARALLAADNTTPCAVLAEAQRAGRGRRGRQWASPVAANLYLSLVEPLAGGIETSRGLSLAVGVAVADAIDRLHGIELQLKWPNDLQVDRLKLGGILVELAPRGAELFAIIGVGLNIRVPDYVERQIDQPWVDLERLTRRQVSRNEMAATLLAGVSDTLAAFRCTGFDASLRAQWQARDPFFGRRVKVSGAHAELVGVARGIDEAGELLIDTDSGLQRIGAGEVSIRLLEHET